MITLGMATSIVGFEMDCRCRNVGNRQFKSISNLFPSHIQYAALNGDRWNCVVTVRGETKSLRTFNVFILLLIMIVSHCSSSESLEIHPGRPVKAVPYCLTFPNYMDLWKSRHCDSGFTVTLRTKALCVAILDPYTQMASCCSKQALPT